MRKVPLFVYASRTLPNLSDNKIYKVEMLDGTIPTIKDNDGKTMIISLDKTDSSGITWIQCNRSIEGC